MAEIVTGGIEIGGCTDPMATNYNPIATIPCVDCCVYSTPIVGCRDPLATNYNSLATISCNGCCTYTATDVLTGGGGFTGFLGTGTGTDALNDGCSGPFSISIEGKVIGVDSAACCTKDVIGEPPIGYDYFWDGKDCLLKTTCPTDLTCVDCNSFDWWNDTYIVNHNGQSLQITSPIVWQQVVDAVANSGQTFYVQTSTGNLLDETCCTIANGTFRDGICFCEIPITEIYESKCIPNLTEFLNFISTTEGYDYFLTNFSSIGGALGLTNTQVIFIKTNIFNLTDSDGNGIPDQTEARLILSNALDTTGGFYVNFGSLTNTPVPLDKGTCDSIGGYWDDVTSQCMCDPIVDQCDIDITQVQTSNILDFYNNPIQVVTQNGTPISEACCNRLIKDYNLPWAWQNPYCYATPKEDCLPVVFTLNDKPIEVSCESDLEISMWVYFGKPENPCQPILDPPNDDIIIIEGEACDITLSPNTGVVVVNPGSGTGNVSTGTGVAVGVGVGGSTGTGVGVGVPIGTGNTLIRGATQNTPTICCYNNLNPILARISLTNPILNPYLIQVKEYNSNADFFNQWIELKATLPTSGLTLTFEVNLEIYQGLNCCCIYDIFVDDIRVDCAKQESLLVINDIKCPGFDLTRVIDNKKSWVYNPGTPEVGTSDYDIIERADGSFGLLNGEGIINRTFAPSLDADIPWRYTDYFNQSSVYERHSNLVLNTKELGLTFDMCADCPISGSTLGCPDGYTLSGTTNVCYNLSGTTSAITVTTLTFLNLFQLENYKKTFQSFWIPFMEQFIPATTIWVAGERWCSEVCTIIDPCDYDFELVDSEISVIPVPTGFFPSQPRRSFNTTVPTTITSQISSTRTMSTGVIPLVSTNLLLINNIGLTTSTLIIRTEEEASIDIQNYRSRFSAEITETVTP